MAGITLAPKEKQLITKAVVFFAVMYGLVFASTRVSTDYTTNIQNVNTELKNELGGYRERLSVINEEELLQSQYVESYNNYRDRNLILNDDEINDEELAAEVNEEQRLFLLTRLQEISEERKFFEIQTVLRAPDQLPQSFSDLTVDSEVFLRANVMSFSLPLLHSLDMLMLLRDFYDPVTNRFTPVSCKMQFSYEIDEVLADESVLLNLDENIKSECILVWLSVFDPHLGTGGNLESEAGQS